MTIRHKYSLLVGIFLTLNSILFGQIDTIAPKKANNHAKVIVTGKVTIKGWRKADPPLGVIVRLENTDLSTFSDKEGKFKLDISAVIDTIKNPVIFFGYVGCKPFKYTINKKKLKDEIIINPTLKYLKIEMKE